MNAYDLAEVRLMLDNTGATDLEIERDTESPTFTLFNDNHEYHFWHIPPNRNPEIPHPGGWVATVERSDTGERATIHPTPTKAVAAWLKRRP